MPTIPTIMQDPADRVDVHARDVVRHREGEDGADGREKDANSETHVFVSLSFVLATSEGCRYPANGRSPGPDAGRRCSGRAFRLGSARDAQGPHLRLARDRQRSPGHRHGGRSAAPMAARSGARRSAAGSTSSTGSRSGSASSSSPSSPRCCSTRSAASGRRPTTTRTARRSTGTPASRSSGRSSRPCS